jgi:TRAP-type mannitol/chloroaromatic compound transport system permease small subunit
MRGGAKTGILASGLCADPHYLPKAEGGPASGKTLIIREPRRDEGNNRGTRTHQTAAHAAADPRGGALNPLLNLSRFIDAITERVGHTIYWLVLVAVLISAANATVRKIFNYSSNSFLEIQWYLFSVIFLFLAGYTLKNNEHVRIDIITGRLSARARAWIEIFGTLFFLLPMAILIMYLSWPVFVDAYARHEVSTNAGGLIVWPARLMVPIGFFLLIIQAVSELIKRFAFLRGMIPDPSEKHVEKTAEEQLAEEILRSRGDLAIAAEFEAMARAKEEKS